MTLKSPETMVPGFLYPKVLNCPRESGKELETNAQFPFSFLFSPMPLHPVVSLADNERPPTSINIIYKSLTDVHRDLSAVILDPVNLTININHQNY